MPRICDELIPTVVCRDRDKITGIPKVGFPADQDPDKFCLQLLYQASPVCSRDCNFVMATHSRKAVVVGGGPVGCLSATALARMGWDVEIYEARPGLRHHTLILNIF
jgi:NADPH-dependent 2,4-dienoyl-CoA reductase/sulfur reductase-like enzyme